jgi:hypothetical protein
MHFIIHIFFELLLFSLFIGVLVAAAFYFFPTHNKSNHEE